MSAEAKWLVSFPRCWFLFILLAHLVVFGCAGSSLLRVALSAWAGRATVLRRSGLSCGGFSCGGAQALGARAWWRAPGLICSGARVRPVSPALAAGFLPSVPAGESSQGWVHLVWNQLLCLPADLPCCSHGVI